MFITIALDTFFEPFKAIAQQASRTGDIEPEEVFSCFSEYIAIGDEEPRVLTQEFAEIRRFSGKRGNVDPEEIGRVRGNQMEVWNFAAQEIGDALSVFFDVCADLVEPWSGGRKGCNGGFEGKKVDTRDFVRFEGGPHLVS